MTIYALTCENRRTRIYSPQEMSRFVQAFQEATVREKIFVDLGINRDHKRGFEEFQICSGGAGLKDPAFLRALQQTADQLDASVFISPCFLPNNGPRAIWTPEPRETIRNAALLRLPAAGG